MDAVAVLDLLVLMNRVMRVMTLTPYLIGGAVMGFLTLKSGVHATIAGVLMAFAIPPPRAMLRKPVAFIILPIFALANTGVITARGGRRNSRPPTASASWPGS